MFSCCRAPKHAKLLTGVFCFVGSLICFFAVGPVYFGTLATPVSKFSDCIECGSKYASYVLNEVNGTAIVDKIINKHDQHQFHRGSHKPDICITDEDLESLDFDDLDVDPLPRTCIDMCSPIAAKAGLAAGCAGATCFAAIALLVISLAAFASFCCCNPTEPPTYVMVDSAPSTSQSIPPPPTGTASSYADTLKAPLMPDEQ